MPELPNYKILPEQVEFAQNNETDRMVFTIIRKIVELDLIASSLKTERDINEHKAIRRAYLNLIKEMGGKEPKAMPYQVVQATGQALASLQNDYTKTLLRSIGCHNQIHR